jgi:CBS domain containing-hemolysin-like protein
MLTFELLPLAVSAALVDVSREATQMDVMILIGSILLALGFSFLCSIAEAVLLSVTPSYIESLRMKSPKRAARLRRLKLENVDRSLAAILTLNTIAHTVGAILSGAKATLVFGSAWFRLFLSDHDIGHPLSL